MRNKETKSLLCYIGIAIVVVAFLMSATSCSTRKVNKSEVKEKTETEVKSTSEIKTEVKTEIFTLDTSTTNEIEFIPIDNTKPIIVDGRKYENVILRRVNKKNNVTTVKNEKASQIEQKAVKTDIVATKVDAKKETERESFSWWWLLLFLIPAYFIFRRKISLFNYF